MYRVSHTLVHMPDVVDIIGFTASVISFLLWLPQARQTWKNRSNAQALAGISLTTQALVVMNATLWGAYAVSTNAFWVGAPGIINAPLAVGTIVIAVRAGRRIPVTV